MKTLTGNTRKSSFAKRVKLFFKEVLSEEVASHIAERQNQYTKIMLGIGSIIWFVYILFDYLFAKEKWLYILPCRIVGGTSFAFFYLYHHKFHWRIKQNYILGSVILALAYMFAIVPEKSFYTYFTGTIFVSSLFYGLLYIPRNYNLWYSLGFLSVLISPMVFNQSELIVVLQSGGFAFVSILSLLIFLADNNRKAIIAFYQNIETIKQQKGVIEEKNQSITESITYAQRIQHSILPDYEVIRRNFQDIFIIYKPKDIVSGDFYWFAESEEKIFIAVADCTGHGVPGAFITLLNNSFLHQSVLEKNIYATNHVLQFVRQRLISTLSQQQNQQIRDGMDIALLSIDKQNSYVEFTGANRPLWIIRKEDSAQVVEINGDKLFVGYQEEWDSTSFTIHNINVQKGDRFYMFTDGFTDFFGGEDGRMKFGKKRLRELLINTYHNPVAAQKTIIEEELKKWQGNEPQIDDMCMLCVEI